MIKNIENIERYFYEPDLSLNREDGVSAIVRVKNEEEFIIPSLLSIKDFFDEIIIILNCSTDKTFELVDSLNLPNLKIFNYDQPIVPAGPESVDVDANSVHNIVYFTNFCISLSSRRWIYRWDGDNVALPNFNNSKTIISFDIYNSLEDRAWDLVGEECNQLGSQEMCSFERRLIRVSPGVKYIQSPNKYAEMAQVSGLSYRVDEPTFVHLKWCAKQPGRKWSNNWQGIHHFKAIKDRHNAIKSYNGPIPDILKLYLDLDKNPYKLIDLYHKGKI